MPNYDFKQLSPHDFEQLTRDLIQARDNIILESFKNGRDLGIDLRHARAGGNFIVQCKHYAGTGVAGLISDLKKEAIKVSRLKPSRYMLVTSLGLTPPNKTTIQALFGNVLATNDILGTDDLNNLLELYPSIQQNHYKLWLASRAVLDRVLYNASVTQSEFDVQRVNRDIRKYVTSLAFPRTYAMLEDGNVAIISGAPGVGKTSLAKMLLYAHLAEGYEVVSILSDFQTGRDRYQAGVKQIFYFDDFIGATFLGERASVFTRNEDRSILDFIEMVRASTTARLVMTTREHILSQAIAASEKLKHSDIIDSRHVLEIGDYNQIQRAQILYNHIYFSELPEDYRAQLLAGRFYKEIVQHKKFNPRLIEWLSTFQRLKSVTPSGYQDFVRNLLADPAEIWLHAYESQISDSARSVLLALYTYSGKCGSVLLEQAFRKLHALRARHYGFKTNPSDWRAALSELNGSFIRPGNQIEVIDPSVLDMLNAVIRRDTSNALDMIEGAVRFEQSRRIWSFALTDDSRNLLAYLGSESVRMTAALDQLLAAPRKIPQGNTVTFIDDNLELRVSTIIQVAETIRSSELCCLANIAVQRLLEGWQSDSPEVTNGVALLLAIKASPHTFPLPNTELRLHITRELVIISGDCYMNEFRELLDAIQPDDLDDDLRSHIYDTAVSCHENNFSDELKQCSSDSEFVALEDDICSIARYTGYSFDGAIESTRRALFEFTTQQSTYEDTHDDWDDMRAEWGAQTHTTDLNDYTVDDLFDSLRTSD